MLELKIAALALALPFYRQQNPATSLPSKKSIAVLLAKAINSANRDKIYESGIADALILKLTAIAKLDSALGRNEDAIREARRARARESNLKKSRLFQDRVRHMATSS
ncbi:MAG: hypothetical protein ACR2II_08555 [Chthoniobacterales bacterium]